MESLMNLTLSEAAGRIALIIAAASVFIQITPIKFNPWTWLAKKIGRAINGEVIEKVDSLESTVNKIQNDIDEYGARNNRTKILRFGDEILHGQKHTKDHFDEILQSITEYDQYCEEHPDFRNHMTATTMRHILDTYESCMRDGTFL